MRAACPARRWPVAASTRCRARLNSAWRAPQTRASLSSASSGWRPAESGLDLRQRAHFLGHRPEHQRRRLAFLLQAIERARQARHIAGEQRFAQAIEVVAGDIEHGFLNLLQRERPTG
jgi:hypothetical protein